MKILLISRADVPDRNDRTSVTVNSGVDTNLISRQATLMYGFSAFMSGARHVATSLVRKSHEGFVSFDDTIETTLLAILAYRVSRTL